MKPTLSRDYFESLYARDRDPWNFETKPYERGKYAATLDGLPRARYGRALELGCSIGVLSNQLAARCDELLGLDISQAALDSARRRCAGSPNARFERATMPDEFPAGSFDLILMSEVGYYFCAPDLARLGERVTNALDSGGDLVAVHYLPVVPDYPQTGDEVHAAIFGWGLHHVSGFRAERFRFDAWRKGA